MVFKIVSLKLLFAVCVVTIDCRCPSVKDTRVCTYVPVVGKDNLVCVLA